MRFRNWLLTGTSITLLALAPASAVRAQDATNPDLVAAYQAYTADQSDDNKTKLNEACIAAGFQSFEDCIAALSTAAPPAPPPASEAAPLPEPSSEEAPPPAPSSEAAPAPAPSEEAAPTPPPSSEEAAPVEPSSEEVAPAPASSSEEAAPVEPSSEAPQQVQEQPQQELAAPSSEEAAPAPSSSEEAAPAPSSSEEAAPVPSSEEAAPAVSSEQPAPSSEQPPANNTLAELTAAVELYNQGVADLTAGDAGGQAKVDQAKATIDKICADGGFADTTTCLAQFGLTLNPLPAQPGEPASSEAAPVPSSEAPPPASSEVPISELPNASEAVTPSAVEVLPSEVKPEEAAPILDSAKDEQKAPEEGQPAQPDASSSAEPAAPSEPPAPPPADDQQAQADITPPPADQQSAVKDKGKKIDAPPEIQLLVPQNTDVPVKVIQAPAPAKPVPNTNGANPPPVQNTGLIVQIGVNIIIRNPEQERDRFYDPRQDQIYYEDLGRGRTRETIERPDGSKIVTVRNRNGDILQRSKITPRGREIILATYDPRDRDIDSWRDPGDDLPPLRLTIPAANYILDADSADEEDVYTFLDQPPVEKVRRIYTIDEVKRSARLRDSVRRLEVGGLTFDSGKATISRNQVGALSKVADAMEKMLQRNPGEVFLIEGHTDAVGSDVSNLVLSDQRAATVARILSDFYDIPPENLVTQGYGERYLKVKTDLAEPINRRVVVKRITPLISYASN
jgi:outer membrane protein OmpA-like peptidoglycan-associated protein